MIVNETYEERNISSVSENQKNDLKEYLKCLVKPWCLITPEKSFTWSELLNNADWEKRPLLFLDKHYKDNGYEGDDLINRTSVDIGWLLKEVISEMPQKFETDSSYRKTYTYIPE